MMRYPVTFILLCVVFAHQSFGTHIAGVDFKYECVGNDSFLINFNVFRDCEGIDAPESVRISFRSDCGNFADTLYRDSITDVSPLCPEEDTNSTCFGGSLPGIQHHWYSGIVEIPQCASGSWEMSWALCCRNPSNNLVGSPNGPSFYVEAILDNGVAPCNNSPVFNAQPIPYFCKDVPASYNFSVTDPDGDSLFYTLDTARQQVGNGNPAPYQGSFHGADPFDVPVYLDSLTGQVNFTPVTSGFWVIKVCANEYRNGTFIGKICRDIQFVVTECENYPPYMEEPGVVIKSNNGVLTDSNSLEVCAGDTVQFEVQFSDSLFGQQIPGHGDSVMLSSNVSSTLPGAIENIQNGNPAIWSVEWVATVGSNPLKNIFLEARDNACPVQGVTGQAVSVYVNEALYVGADIEICSGEDTAFITDVEGGNYFTWSVISGDPIQLGNNFIDTTGLVGDSVWAFPSGVTTYLVESDLISDCGNTDTVTVFASRNFEINLFGDTVVCTHEASTGFPVGVIPDTVSGAAYSFSYQWSDPGELDNDTIANPTAFPLEGEQREYTVTVTSDSGCSKSGSVNVGFYPAFPDSLKMDFLYNPLCLGDSTPAYIDFGIQPTGDCGVSDDACLGLSGTGVSGSDQTANGPSDANSVYPNRSRGARIQMLYRANELSNMGMIPGTRISAVSFFVQARNGIIPLEDYEIKITCTQDTSLSDNWNSESKSTVYFDSIYHVQGGLNTHDFDSLYQWDGTSNLVIEICYFNSTTSTTNNASVRFTPTPGFTSMRTRISSNSNVCNFTSSDYVGNERSNTRFSYCNPFDRDAFTVTWNPSAFLSSNKGDSVLALPDTTTEYTVIVEDTSGNCSKELIDSLEVVTEYDVSFSFSEPLCLDSDPDTAEVETPGGVFAGIGITDTILGIFDPGVLSHDTFMVSHTIVSHTGNCFSSDTIEVAVVPPPPTQFTGPEYFCTGADSVVYTGNPDNGVWSTDSGDIDSLSGELIASSLPGAGEYHIVYDRTSPCARIDTLTVTAYIPPTAGLDTLFEVCNNDSLQLVADTIFGAPHDSLPPRFTWFGSGVADSAAGIIFPDTLKPDIYTINLRLTDSAGTCSDTVQGEFRVLPLDTPRILDPLNFCANSGLVEINTSPVFHPDSGFLEADPIISDSDTLVFGDSARFNTDVFDSAAWQLTYLYTNGFGCTASTFDTLYVNPLPSEPDISPAGFCVGEQMNLTAEGSGFDTLYWFLDTAHLTHSPVHVGNSFNAGTAETGEDKVYLTAQLGKCMGEPFAHDIEVLDYPEAEFDLDYEAFNRETERVHVTKADVRDGRGYFVPDRKILSAYPAEVYGTAVEQPIPDSDTIHWNFDFTSTSISREDAWINDSPEAGYEYFEPGIYRIKMIRVNELGCADSTYILMELINGEESPNVFTPNGDGVNDEFLLRSAEGIENYRISVYNRWGILIWEETMPQIGWKGRTFSGQEVSDGVYYFVATGNYPSGTDYVRKGYIQLMR